MAPVPSAVVTRGCTTAKCTAFTPRFSIALLAWDPAMSDLDLQTVVYRVGEHYVAQ